mgnify:CR=1 FL=1
MNKCINIHINPKNMHKNEKSSRHLGRKWYHGTIQSQMNIGEAQQRFCEWGSGWILQKGGGFYEVYTEEF